MGCVASRIDKEERVQRCKERKRLMKQLLGFRSEFAAALMAYLQALKNTGVTLRQFTEAESLELNTAPFGLAMPPSPFPRLPPSPPPPPSFSPDLNKSGYNQKEESLQEEYIETDEDNNCTPPPPPLPSSSWDFWDPFGPSSQHCQKNGEVVEQFEEEDWAETNTELEEEEEEGDVVADIVLSLLPEKPAAVELTDDNSSMMSWCTKDTADMAMVIWRNKKTLAGIVSELDDYFLKALAGGKGNSGPSGHQQW